MTGRRPPADRGARRPSDDPAAARAAGAAVLALSGAAAVAVLALAARTATGARRPRAARDAHGSGEARHLHGAASLLAASVLADSAIEHYRGSFENPGMYAPLVTSALTMLAGRAGAAGGGRPPSRARGGAYALAVAVGVAGLAFHVTNVARRPGGVSWLNLFYAAPLGAPAALSLAGLIGVAAERLVEGGPGQESLLAGWPAGRVLAALTAGGLAGTVGEVGLLHFRGAYHDPFMWLPVTVPPVAAALTARAAIEGPREGGHPATRGWLIATAVLGLAGVGFHAFGVSRRMGGWRNASQNVVDGPPLPAPPAFSALALAGLAALRLLDRRPAASEGRR